jgi:two-component system response regulator FixJ
MSVDLPPNPDLLRRYDKPGPRYTSYPTAPHFGSAFGTADGAFDFLQKPFRDQDLIDRIQRALAKDQTGRAELRERSRIKQRLETLTAREREVLELVASGKPNKIMAADLGVSQRTVEIHRARVMEKMGASSLAQLVRMVLDLKGGAETAV